MERNDYDYFRQRERAERANAERAQDQTARCAHLDMAERYAERVRTMPPPAASDATA